MEKTEMMKRYEKETGMCCAYDTLFDWDFSLTDNYIAWLEAKATSYDRLMSGGKKTLKEWANFLGMVVTVDRDGATWAYPYRPICDGHIWRSDGDNWLIGAFEIPKNLVDYSGDWKDSLTLPDGWEDKR